MNNINNLNKLAIECQLSPNTKRYIICDNLEEIEWYNLRITISDKYVISYGLRGCDYEFAIHFKNLSELIFKLKDKRYNIIS